MRPLIACAAVMACLAAALPAQAGGVLDRVRANHVVRCGAPAHPGLADSEGSTGLLPDICRAIAAAAGPGTTVAFHIYDADKDFDAVRDGADDVFFLDASEVVAQRLAGLTLPGPTVFVETISVIVKDASPARHVADMAGRSICFLLGDNAQRALEAWSAANGLAFIRMAYQEPDEMWDAFDAGPCHGLVGETTSLAEAQRGGGRLLGEPLAAFPILAMTGTSDAQWSALVAWTIDTLIAADAPKRDWAAGGADALPLDAPQLGLADGWQRGMLASVGSYADIYRRNLGAASPYRLPEGPNAAWRNSGLMLAPYAE